MTSHQFTRKTQAVEFRGWLAPAAIVAAAGVGALVVALAVINGPEARAMIERENAAEIAQENQNFCTYLGIAARTDAFRACADGLAQIRQKHEERLHRDSGIF